MGEGKGVDGGEQRQLVEGQGLRDGERRVGWMPLLETVWILAVVLI